MCYVAHSAMLLPPCTAAHVATPRASSAHMRARRPSLLPCSTCRSGFPRRRRSVAGHRPPFAETSALASSWPIGLGVELCRCSVLLSSRAPSQLRIPAPRSLRRCHVWRCLEGRRSIVTNSQSLWSPRAAACSNPRSKWPCSGRATSVSRRRQRRIAFVLRRRGFYLAGSAPDEVIVPRPSGLYRRGRRGGGGGNDFPDNRPR